MEKFVMLAFLAVLLAIGILSIRLGTEIRDEETACIMACDNPESVVVDHVCFCKTFYGSWVRGEVER